MAANIDAIAIVAAFEQPSLHLAMIDELLAFAEIHEIRPFILLTKSDLASEEQMATIPPLYRGLGYPTFELQPKTGIGVDAIRTHLAACRTLLIGQSGVGKSSLFQALGGSAAVGAVSKHGQGRQTTTSGRLHRFGEGFLIDSPGIGDFELHGLAWNQIIQGFVELWALAGKCRFRDCAHCGEPNCAIRAACEAGTISAGRYQSYRTIVERTR
jgi:ribosome biogenesis GTPase